MKLLTFLAAATLFIACPVFAQEVSGLPCKEADKDCLRQLMKSHAVHKLATWKADMARPPAQRIAPAPAQLVEYLLLDNVLNGYPERPRAAVLDAGFLQDVRDALADLPAPLLRLFEQRLIGLYFVEELGGTGLTDLVKDPDNRGAAGFVVLDAAVLRRHTANAWASWKENTPFKPQDGWRLDARIEDGANDSRKNAIQYILLHELGHVLSGRGDIHPHWGIDIKEVPETARFPFFELSWRMDRAQDRYVTAFDDAFPQRKSIAYYFGAKLDATDMAPTYASLVKTNFPSLYAATHPGDDFAEAFASYVHVVLLGRPWQITISRNGEVVTTFKACWDEPRCAGKRAVLERLLKGAD